MRMAATFWREGIEMDELLGAHYLKESADQGNELGQWGYGIGLENGSGTPKNVSLAAHYYKLSADQGDRDGQSHDGRLLSSGDGIFRD
jgi:TPR repeat protein